MWKFPFLPSFDFCPFKAKDKDSLLACCEEIVSCRDFIRVTVAEHRKARASSTNSNKLVSLLSLMLLDFKSLKRNISSEGHDSKDSEEQWVNNQLKSITAEMNWTLKGNVNQICRNLLITLHGQVLANYPNPHQPVLQAEPNHQSAIIYRHNEKHAGVEKVHREIFISDTKERTWFHSLFKEIRVLS